MIIAHYRKKRKPYFINKHLIKGNTTAIKEAVKIITKGYSYLALVFTFLLGSYNGYIALWKDNHSHPVQVFPYSVQSLPPADQVRLSEGIPIGSIEQLQSLLQDYLS